MTKIIKKISELHRLASKVKQAEKKSYLAQLFDLIALYRINPTCNLWDYYRYRIYACPRGSAIYSEILGLNSLESLSKSLNPRHAVSAAWDKILFSIICDAYKLPAAEIHAVYKEDGNIPQHIGKALLSINDIRKFLSEITEPVFVKPVKCVHGDGAYCVASYDPEKNIVSTTNGKTFTFDEFIHKTIRNTAQYYNPDAGYLFQQPVIQHQELTDFTGTQVPSGFRFVVLNKGKKPRIHRVIWKLISPGNINDNFSSGRTGNMIVSVHPETGQLEQAVTGNWPFAEYKAVHSQTQKPFKEFTIPMWEDIKSIILKASAAFNGLGILHWDVILGKDGPVLLELNDIGGTNILQMHEKGVIDKKMATYMQEHANLNLDLKLKKLVNKRLDS